MVRIQTILQRKTIFQFIKHMSVGGLGVIINYSLFVFLVKLNFGTIIANSVTNAVVIVVMFFLQKYFTYKVDKNFVWQIFFFLISVLFNAITNLC